MLNKSRRTLLIRTKRKRRTTIARPKAATEETVTITTTVGEGFYSRLWKIFRVLLKAREDQSPCQFDLIMHIYSHDELYPSYLAYPFHIFGIGDESRINI
jgi:hypothetical protein